MGLVIVVSIACLVFLLTPSGYAVNAVQVAEAERPTREDIS